MQRDRDPRHWKLFVFCYDSENPRLFVLKRTGVPLTMNYARPAAWIITGGFAALLFAGTIMNHLH